MIKLKSLIIETTNTKIERVGYDPKEESSDMPINWDEPDVQILDKWNINTIRQFAGLSKLFTAKK